MFGELLTMINYSLFRRIYYSGDTNLFRGGISSFQIKVRAFFNEEDIKDSLFVFIGKSFKQIKLYYETDKGTWLTIYRIRRGKFIIPKDFNTHRITIEQLKWVIEGFDFVETQNI